MPAAHSTTFLLHARAAPAGIAGCVSALAALRFGLFAYLPTLGPTDAARRADAASGRVRRSASIPRVRLLGGVRPGRRDVPGSASRPLGAGIIPASPRVDA